MDAVSQELHGKQQRIQADLLEAQHQVLAISLCLSKRWMQMYVTVTGGAVLEGHAMLAVMT